MTQPTNAARTAAVRRLIDAHPDEYRAIYEEEAEARGIQPRGKRPLAPCGTDAGFQRHHRDGEAPCAACRQASNARQNEERAAKREAAKVIAADLATRHLVDVEHLRNS